MEQASFTLKLSEQGGVIILGVADRINLGGRNTVCQEMCRFLPEVDFGECGQ